jgi:hypothetical protein
MPIIYYATTYYSPVSYDNGIIVQVIVVFVVVPHKIKVIAFPSLLDVIATG